MQMNANDWERAKELFEAALELDASQRTSFLAANCHDVSLQQQVEKLLIDYQAAGSFLDNPALNSAETPMDQVSRILPSPEEHHARATSEETEDPLINRRLGDYKLVRRVGRGGMAAVFLAVRADEEYQKEVAVKLVQPGLDSQDVLTRFRNERQTLAGLDHPNIVRLLDGGSTQEGLPFLVMEYVEGSPIDEYCDQHKLSIDERLRLFSDVCAAVRYAHEKRVIHRDLKPSNLLVLADGTPKLLDFGIAKVLNPEPNAQSSLATQTSLRCMTPAYASPEQMRGKSVTPETDVYSLGVVLYELLTGHRPYRLTQHSPAEMERAICEQEPEIPSTAISRVETDPSPGGKPITKTPELVSLTREGEPDKLRRRLRGDLDNIVLKALRKEPRQRYGSVAEFSRDIDRHLQHQPVKARPSTLAYRVSKFVQRHKAEVSAAAAVLVVIAAALFTFNAVGLRDRFAGKSSGTRIQSLAVLPLANLSGDPAQEYFSDGITDALITDLSEISSLKIISRTSSVQYKQTKKTLPEIARELNVDGIIEGTVRRSGERVHITANLIQAATDKRVWTRSYERDVRDAFTLEREVASDIAGRVRSRITTESEAVDNQPRTPNLEAFDSYLQGIYHLNRGSMLMQDEELRNARVFFQRSIDADPMFAPAYVGLAETHHNLWWASSEDLGIMKSAANRAVDLAPSSSEAHAEVALAKWEDWDWSGAEEEFRKAIALNRNNAPAHDQFGQCLDAVGRLEEGWKEHELAQELDPTNDYLSMGLYWRGDYERTIERLRTRLQTRPEAPWLWLLSEIYAQKGMHKEWMQELSQSLTLYGNAEAARLLEHAFATSGYLGARRWWAKELEQMGATKRAYFPGVLAQVYATLGENDRALYWLQQGCEHHYQFSGDPIFIWAKIVPAFASLRSDPRFKDLLRCLGLPEVPVNDSGVGSARNAPRDNLAANSSRTRIESLAVIPLVNLSGDANQEYFSDGLTDALITDLAQIASLKVISRTSSARYKQTNKSLQEIARELNVDGIVEGTVQRSGDRVRITAQLIQVPEDRHLWASSYEREMRDVFALERDVTEEIARQVRVRLRMPNDAPLTQPLQVNPKALDAYLQGNYHLTRGERSFNDEEKRKAAQYFQEAIDVEPNFTPAYIGLANAHDNLRLGSREDTATRTKAAEKALVLDRKSSEALGILANVKWANFEWSMAETEYRQAVELNPNSASAHDGLGDVLAATGRLDEALREAQIAQALDPNGEHLPQILEMRGEYDRASDLLLGMAKGSPEDGIIHYDLFRTYAASGKQKEAVEEMEKALMLFGMSDGAANMRRGFSLSGYSGAIRELARGTERLQANNEAFLPENLAAAYTALGEKDRAFYWLEQAYEHHDKVSHDWGLMIVKVDPLLAPLRSDPRFKDLLRRVGLPP